MSKRIALVASLLLACAATAHAAKPPGAPGATPAVPATPGGPNAGGSPATPAVPPGAGGGGHGATPAIPATPAVPGDSGTPATPAIPATPAVVPSSEGGDTALTRHLNSAALGPPSPRGSAPTCGTSAPSTLAAAWACSEPPDAGNSLTVSWSAEGLTCEPTKYALSVTGFFTDPSLDPPEECTVQVTSHFTVFAPDTSLTIAWEDLQDSPLVFCSEVALAVKVKALTTAPGGSNRSQNNAFATADATGNAAGDACVAAP